MSVIDKKGKLFGKLNIIDLIVIILIVAVVALLGYKLTSNQGSTGLSGSGQHVVYTVEVKGVEPEVYEYIQDALPGQLMAASEELDGQVTKVEAKPSDAELYEIEDKPGVGTVLHHIEAGTYDLLFTIEANVKDSLTSELGTQEVRVGKSHIVKTTTFELVGGVILSCDRSEENAEAPAPAN